MSYLSLPRFNFKGGAYCNPPTGNNNDLADIFNIDTLELTPTMTTIPGSTVVDPSGEQSFNYTGPDDATACRNWLMGYMNTGLPDETTGQQAHWNYYGDHGTRLETDTIPNTVTTISPRPGVAVPPNDPLYNAKVSLVGTPSPMQFQDAIIVDNDPYALITSQIFSHGFTVTGTDGNGKPVDLITANPASRAYAYYINVAKNLDPNCIGFQGVSAVFQLAVPKGPGLVINTNADSPALVDLAAAVAQGAGLQMRFIFYDALFEITPEQMYANFAAGNYTANPYLGTSLGTIGVLSNEDMLSAPPGRKLNVQTGLPFNLVGTQCGTDPDDPTKNSGTVNLGITPALLDVANARVTLDCISTFPECNKTTQSKYDFGTAYLNFTPSGGGQPINLGAIPNDAATYQQNSGMVDISLAGHPQLDQIANDTAGTLSIFAGGVTALAESTGLDIQTEDRAIYFDAQTLTNWNDPAETPTPGTSTITIRAFRQGVPVQESVPIYLEYWMCAKDQINPSKPQVPCPARYYTVSGAVAQSNTSYTGAPGNPGTISVITDQVVIPANSNGQITLTLTALKPGTSVIRFRDPAIPPPNPPNPQPVAPNFVWDNTDYACIRILPFDDYRAIPNSQVAEWPYIYANFFNFFALLYPIMSMVIPWGPTDAPNNPDIVKQFAGQMKVFTNPEHWDTTIYMPITRDLSAGKRALLWRWCSLQGA